LEAAQDLVDPCARVELELLVDLLPVDLGEPRGEQRRLPRLEPRLDGPVFLRHEGGDLTLALDDDAHRHRLHASSGQAPPDLPPDHPPHPPPPQPPPPP